MKTAPWMQAHPTPGAQDLFYCRVSNRVISRCPWREGVENCPLRGECPASRAFQAGPV